MATTQSMLMPGPAVPFEDARVADYMHPGVLTCPLETPLNTVARMMAAYRIHAVVVFSEDEDGAEQARVWGVVSDLDLAAVAGAEAIDDRTAGGTAVSPVVTVTPDESLVRAAQLMTEHGTAHLIVVQPGADRPVGILSTLDVATALAAVRAARPAER